MSSNQHALDGGGVSSQSFRFLDLPAELRTVVYEEMASETYLSNLETINSDPLLQVCKLIRKEYKPIFPKFVTIELSVNSWRFTPITSSISRLKTKKDAMATLEAAENITISTPVTAWNDDHLSLVRTWVRARSQNPAMDIKYKVYRSKYGPWLPKAEFLTTTGVSALRQVQGRATNEASGKEVGKIINALEQAAESVGQDCVQTSVEYLPRQRRVLRGGFGLGRPTVVIIDV